ncbi:MAG: O-antigen ligase family protein [Clostridia bacterium]|nr:O-antigen ligase family protein [Clostridia bacterium]
MSKSSVDGTGFLNIYDRLTGVFNEIFDSRLLTVALIALEGYCVLFTQRKFPMRWMYFVLFGMILLLFVTLSARTGTRRRVSLHKGMMILWFSLHGMMVLSGLFYQDWLPESVSLLICYPFTFTVFASRSDDATFRPILRACVIGALPFLIASWIRVPLSPAYPGYMGIFYDANCLAMSCVVMATASFLLAYVNYVEHKLGLMLLDCVLGILGFATLVCTLSRSCLLAFCGVALVLISSIIAGTAKHPKRWLAAIAILVILGIAGGIKITRDKIWQAYEEDYALAIEVSHRDNVPVTLPKPEERTLTMDDLTSDRWGIWTEIVHHITWNGHETSVIREWVAKDGAGDRHFNAHNAFLGIIYNNGIIAGLLLIAYTILATVRAFRYYWLHRHKSPLACTPLAFCVVFILVGMFESVYAPFSVIGCTFLLVQAPLWRSNLEDRGE